MRIVGTPQPAHGGSPLDDHVRQSGQVGLGEVSFSDYEHLARGLAGFHGFDAAMPVELDTGTHLEAADRMPECVVRCRPTGCSQFAHSPPTHASAARPGRMATIAFVRCESMISGEGPLLRARLMFGHRRDGRATIDRTSRSDASRSPAFLRFRLGCFAGHAGGEGFGAHRHAGSDHVSLDCRAALDDDDALRFQG